MTKAKPVSQSRIQYSKNVPQKMNVNNLSMGSSMKALALAGGGSAHLCPSTPESQGNLAT